MGLKTAYLGGKTAELATLTRRSICQEREMARLKMRWVEIEKKAHCVVRH